MAIFYSLIGSATVALIMKWAGFFRWARRKYRQHRGIRAYKKVLTEECETLIVVGRRRGFKIDDVFIPLDLAPSDLMPTKEKEAYEPQGPFVLVGGPGVGKSTLAKKYTLEALRSSRDYPFFVRLRDYSGFEAIEDYLVEQIRKAGIPDPEIATQTQLTASNCYCVLDGLDEVRPHLRAKVCDDINKFYSRHFSQAARKKLIVTCRKEAYRDVPLDIPEIWEVRPLTDNQIKRFADEWPLGYPTGKNKDTFWRDLAGTPRILELARSPLLLVGGLMQYTESNLGIPDERFEYLARVAKWLVSDWATAQGHPPDPLRPVYSRVLSRMAFYLHSNNTSECSLPQAIALVKSWLPNFGLEESKAEELIRSIAIRTGILVSEGYSTFIFAQFGLQEYFASLELQGQISADKVAELEPKTWWREVILLSAAQMRDPSPLLNALFVNTPLLAVTAVAECPTPSTEMQERAIVACLDGIDRKDGTTAGAVVPLLRKISAPLEQRLCAALEERLYKEEEIASLVGRSLATAGTAAATNILGRHPEIWDKCLSEAGYLSSSFENMLVDLIRDGNDQQSGRAAELITTRLSMDRLVELTNLLPVLTPTKSEHLASLLLRHIEGTAEPELYYGAGLTESYIMWVVSRCVPYVRNREGYLKLREVRRSERKGVYREFRYHLAFEGDIVSTALFLERKKLRCNSDQILKFLANSMIWARMRSSILCWLCAAVMTIIMGLGPTMKAFVSIPVLLIVAFCSTYPRGTVPWLPHRIFRWGGNLLSSWLLLLSGALITLSLTMNGNYILKGPIEDLSQMGLALCCCLVGFVTRHHEALGGYLLKDLPAPGRKRAGIQLQEWSSVAFAVFLVVCIASSLFMSKLTVVMSSLILLSAVFLLWLLFIITILNYSRRAVQRATEQAEYSISRIRL
ncbi:MAG: NACHT domain-containing protein [Syntrophales bacterium]